MSDLEQDNDSLIAVIGMAGRFPGANTIDEFWQNLCAGRDTLTRFPLQDISPWIAPDLVNDPDFVPVKGILDSAAMFDADFFGMSVREAEMMDPQQRVFLECAWHALEDAGYVGADYDGLVSVYGGMGNNSYFTNNLRSNPDTIQRFGEFQTMVCNEKDFVSTRVAHKLNLTGPSISVNTGCSTSLVAIAEAFNSLLNYQCDVALAGGVSIQFPEKTGYLYHEGGIGSVDGKCRTFDAEATGTIFSSGVGIVVLKRLDEALEHGDHIHAVIRSVGVNNDGADKLSFTAPSVAGQATAIQMAHAGAEIDTDSIVYVEAHGTATPVGDPIEVEALNQAFKATTDKKHFCGIGSVKSNIGHTDAAAGVASFIKTVLILKHKHIPPSLHFSKPNPAINFSDSPFYVVDKAVDLPADKILRAGVSSFGVGGTNAHVILEQAPQRPEIKSDENDKGLQLIPLSAKTPTALQQTVENLQQWLRQNPNQDLQNIAGTYQRGRESFQHRTLLVARTTTQLADQLATIQPVQLNTPAAILDDRASVVFLFPGGGSQYSEMAKGLFETETTFHDEINHGLGLLKSRFNIDLSDIWTLQTDLKADSEKNFQRPSLQLPAIFIVEMALANWWIGKGVKPQALLGHSLGENTAACLAGVLSYEDALGLVVLRGQLFERLPAGGMISVSLSADELAPYLKPGLDLATVNAPNQSTVSGSTELLQALHQALQQDDIECQIIPISIAAHSHMLEPILNDFLAYLQSVALQTPKIPILSNFTGTWLSDQEARDPHYWVKHLRNTVLFSRCVETLLDEDNRVFLEVGPGKILGSLVKLHAPKLQHRVIPSLRHPKEEIDDQQFLYESIGKLWSAGVVMDWDLFKKNKNFQRVSLPLYPFQHKRHLVEYTPPSPANPAVAATQPVTSQIMNSPFEQFSPELVTQGEMPVQVSRKDFIAAELKEIICELSGIDSAGVDDNATFIALGFDSLFLTQANIKFKRRFKVRITFRQLYEEAPCIDALATYIDSQLADDAFQDEIAKLNQATTAAPTVPSTIGVAPAPQQANAAINHLSLVPPVAADPNNTSLVHAIQMQMQASQAILNLLTQSITSPQAAMATQNVAAPTTAPTTNQTGPAQNPQQNPPPGASPSPAPAKTNRQFGAYRPLDKSGTELTEQQAAALSNFVEQYSTRTAKSKQLTKQQRNVLSDARAISGFRKYWKEMVYQLACEKTEGPYIWDIDGNKYIDLTCGFGINLFGYSPKFVVDAIQKQLAVGFGLGTLTPLAKEAADLMVKITGMERVTFVNTGSEANAAAVRAARTTTGKEKIVVFDSEYHGMSDELLVKGVQTNDGLKAVPVSPGIPQFLVDNVIILDFADPNFIDVIRDNADDIAAVIIEPMQSRTPSNPTHLMFKKIREVTQENDIAMIFDELITGFRLHPQGAQGYFGIEVDMCCYGKVLSGGMSMAAVGGRGRYLDAFDGGLWDFGDDTIPEADVTYFGGTFSRHPLAMAACVATLKHIDSLEKDFYERLNERAKWFAGKLNNLFKETGFPAKVDFCGSIFVIAFADGNPLNMLLYWYLRHKGVYIYDRPFYLSSLNTEEQLNTVVDLFAESLAEMKAAGYFSAVPTEGAPAKEISPEPADTQVAIVKHTVSTIPFNEAQLELWLLIAMWEEAAQAFHEQEVLEINARLDEAALEEAIQRMVQRHPVLKTTVDAETFSLIVHDDLVPTLEVVDLTSSGSEQDAGTEEIISQCFSKPFDFNKGPLIRYTAVRLENDKTLLITDCHHLIADGWSMDIIRDDISYFYQSILDKKAMDRGLGIDPTSYVTYENEYYATEDFLETEKFWLDAYSTLPEPLDLPLDFPRPKDVSYAGKRIKSIVDAKFTQQLHAFSKAENCTLFVSMFSAYLIFLHRLTGQEDIVIGVPSAGQAQFGERDLVTHCVNFLPIRVVFSKDDTVRSLMQKVRTLIQDINDNQHYTFGKLVKTLKLPRDQHRTPLLSVGFNLDKGDPQRQFAGVTYDIKASARDAVKYDLSFNICETDELGIEVDYRSGLFSGETVQRWLAFYEAILQGIMLNANANINSASWTLESDKKLLAQWNSTQSDYESKWLPDLLDKSAAQHPNSVAVRCGKQTYTYLELSQRANQLAHYLQSLDITRGDFVGICINRSVDMLVGVLGILKAGAAYIPLDPDYPAERLQFMLETSAVKVLLTETTLQGVVSDFQCRRVCIDKDWEDIGKQPKTSPQAAIQRDDLAYVIFTSGSTGKPKGVQVPHGAVANFLHSMAQTPGLTANDKLLAVTTLSFDIAVLELYLPLTVGATCVIADRNEAQDGRALVQLIEENAINVMQATPSTWRMLLKSEWKTNQHFKALCGGEAFPHDLAQSLSEHVGEVWNMYGPTETTVWSTCFKISKSTQTILIGSPIANTQCHVLNDALQPQPIGVAGELYIGGDGVTLGYLGRADLTDERFIKNPFSDDPNGRLYKTGDLVRWRQSGELEYLGRLDDQVKLRGFRIELGEIESALAQLEGVSAASVYLWNVSQDDVRLVACCVTENNDSLQTVKIRKELRKLLPSYMIPQYFLPIKAIPLLPNGKVDRRSLPNPEIKKSNILATSVLNSDVERLIAGIWTDLIKPKNSIGREDNFFEIGGHSMLALEAIRKIEDRTGKRLSPKDMLIERLYHLADKISIDSVKSA